MLSFGNEVEVQQGEEWNYDRLISASDTEYIPFIVSSERQNPMIAITVASTKFEKNERYVATWWLELKDLPRFFQTVPDTTTFGEIDENTPLVKPENDPPMYCLYQFTLSNEELDPNLGHRPYHYVYFNEEDPNTPQLDYEFRIRMQFQSEITAQWGSQNYMYQITLLDTIYMANYIQEAKDIYPDLNWPTWVNRDDPEWIKPIRLPGESDESYNERVEASWIEFRNNWIMDNVVELYTFIKNRIPTWFQSDIDIDAPVGRIDIPQIILPPTKLQVNNNLRKLI